MGGIEEERVEELRRNGTLADLGRYTDFLVNEIGEDGKVVHLTSLEYGGRGKLKQHAGAAGDQEGGAGTEKQEKKDEDEPAKQPGLEESPAPTPLKEFEVLGVLLGSLNVWLSMLTLHAAFT